MDHQTVQFYVQHAREIAPVHRQATDGVERYFAQSFTPDSTVLDIGCGSGRDLNNLIEADYDAYGIEPCEQFVGSAVGHYPNLRERVTHDSMPDLETVPDATYDGVLCAAVLMHLPEELLFDSVYAIRRILKPNGRLLVSIPVDNSIENNRDDKGRLFNGLAPENFQLIFERIGFRMISRWDDSDSLGRSQRQWVTMLFTLESTDGSRSLDKIEGILNRDDKVSTYKLALFRALAEIATTNYNSAVWRQDGNVLIPVSSVAEKWIEYYWPLVAYHDVKIAQTTGTQIAFRSKLEELISCYKEVNGGLAKFSLDYRNNRLGNVEKKIHSKLMSALKSTIWNQPVRYAGGGAHFSTLGYDKLTKCIIIPADMWRELSLTGSWIKDATILRWAELTNKINKKEVKIGLIVDLLMSDALPKREVSAAKKVYDQLEGKSCVWSGRGIKDTYDVDHAIPFSLWHNNDLWNLLPANSSENKNKSDKLPNRGVVIKRRSNIVDYWKVMHDAYPERFNYEIELLCGKSNYNKGNWENKLFTVFSEAIEVTAVQRGVPRWEPSNIDAISATLLHKQPVVISDAPKCFEIIEFPEMFDDCIPLLQATGGVLDLNVFAGEKHEHKDWIKLNNQSVSDDMFAVKIVGHSMEPKICDGDYCLFRAGSALGGSRSGRIVLIQHHEIRDPDTTDQFTVKQYHSEKVYDEYGNLQHTSITLKPLNSEYESIVIDHVDADDEFKVVGEFVSVL